MQTTLEFGVFAAVTVLAGRLDPQTLAAHQIVANLAGLTFMVPLGISAAGAVRVGQAVGRRDAVGARRAGWLALGLGVTFMSVAAATFVTLPGPILRLFTADARVLETGVVLLLLAALFQLFDGVQVVPTGVLRGLGDTRTAMLSNLAGHWVVGLPVGYALCFSWGMGVGRVVDRSVAGVDPRRGGAHPCVASACARAATPARRPRFDSRDGVRRSSRPARGSGVPRAVRVRGRSLSVQAIGSPPPTHLHHDCLSSATPVS